MKMTNTFKYCAIIILAAVVTGCGSSRQVYENDARRQISSRASITNTQPDSLYKIRPGDEVEILVWEQERFNTSTTVSNNGTIVVPLIGEINVTGLTRAQLERELIRRLSEYMRGDINITVSVRSTNSMQVSVFGMVTQPNNYQIVDETSIFRVLSMAGGPSEEANIRRVKIYRKSGDPSFQVIDLTYYLESGKMDDAALVYPGDIIYVPQQQNAVREMSDFLRDVVLLFGIFRVVN